MRPHTKASLFLSLILGPVVLLCAFVGVVYFVAGILG